VFGGISGSIRTTLNNVTRTRFHGSGFRVQKSASLMAPKLSEL
jgi:hypothetical protein